MVAICACGALLLSIHPALGALVFIGAPGVAVSMQSAATTIARRVQQQQEEVGRATALAADLIRGLRPLQGIGAQGNAAARYRFASRRSLHANLRASRALSVHEGAVSAAGALAAVAVAVAAAYFTSRGSLSPGQLITVIGVAGYLTEPFELLAAVPGSLAKARASANRLAHMLNAPTRLKSRVPASATGSELPGTLTIHVAKHANLDGLSLRVDTGELVAIFSTNPSDAIALIDLISGWVETEDCGTVCVGGRRVDEIPPGERHSNIIVEHHNPDLFSGTLASNLGVSGGSNLYAALEASCATEVIKSHPDGLMRSVSERGANLSGGQRQRCVLARALAADPLVLVLHNPTTSVDAVTELSMANGIRRLRAAAGHTTVVFTSSPALLAAADRVVCIVDGRVRGEGTHREMLSRYVEYRNRVRR